MDTNSKDRIETNGRFAIGGSLLSGFAAFVGASCCVLPLILFNLGAGSAVIAQLAFFARNKDLFFICALIMLAIGIVAAFWGGRKPAKRVVVGFFIAAALIGTSYILPFYEPDLIRALGLKWW